MNYNESFCTITDNGIIIWKKKNGKIHRDNDEAAVERPDGTKEWYVNGKRHREIKPAIEYFNGDKEWYLNDKPCREDDLPAAESINGDKSWYINGKSDRNNNLPAVELANGDKAWLMNGVLHRTNGAAIEHANGDKFWFLDGKPIDCKTQEKFLSHKKLKKYLQSIK